MKLANARRGVTLIETIVVIAIIAALAAIAFPVFARARENARRSACVSNLHQIGLAIALYRADYDGIDPVKGRRLSHSEMGLPYHTGIEVLKRDYIRSKEVLFCPSFAESRTGLGSSYWWAVTNSEYLTPDTDWEGAAAARGPDYPLMICGSHNGNIERRLRRSSDILLYLVLRIDGRVDRKKTTVAGEGGGPYWW